MTENNPYDLIIVGGGIAGMTAAIYAARANLKPVIVERMVCGGLVNSTYEVQNFPSQISINGMALMEMVQEQVLNLGVHIEQVAVIEAMDLISDTKTVITEDEKYSAPAVILATGRDPIRLVHLDDCEQVHYCSICDGPSYKGKRVIVIGGGNSAFDESQYLISLGIEHITITEMMDRCIADQATQNSLIESEKADIRVKTTVKDIIVENGKLSAAVLEDLTNGATETVLIDGIFVFIGQKPNTDLFGDVIKLSEKGYILADQDMQTNISGVFAAGDIVDKKYRQITTAMNDGTISALSAEAFLRNRDRQRH